MYDAKILIKSDLYRYYGNKAKNGVGILKYLITNPPFAFTFWFRLASINWIGRPMAKIMKTLIGRKRCLMISEHTPIGVGFRLLHGYGVIINPSATIGNNCTISQFTTIGAMEGNAAFIGDDVYIGPSVSIVENVVIGNNSSIGAGAVVVKDVPEHTTVAGVPAKIISNNSSEHLIINKFIYENNICNKHS